MTVEEMTDTLNKLGVEVMSTRGDEINATCVAHHERTGHEDRNPSFWINSDSGAFICFSCQWKGNIYTLISYVEGIDYENAQNWVSSEASMLARFQRLGAKKEEPKIAEPTVVTESMLSAFTEVPVEACKSRGILPSSAKKYGIIWDGREQNWVIPIRDPQTSSLIGWQEKGYARRFFKNMAKVKKSEALFGYENYKGGDLIVVESPLDVVRLDSLGYTGVAVMGSMVSDTQFKLISGADRIIFALDNDEAGAIATQKVIKECVERQVEAWFFNYDGTDMKDVGAMSKDEVEYGLNNAKHIVRWQKWYATT